MASDFFHASGDVCFAIFSCCGEIESMFYDIFIHVIWDPELCWFEMFLFVVWCVYETVGLL